VIAGDHRIEVAAHRPPEYRVSRKWAVDPNPPLLSRLDRRAQDCALLMTEQAFFAGVRIESGGRRPRA
jgi:hypothetical protein